MNGYLERVSSLDEDSFACSWVLYIPELDFTD